MAMSTCRPGSSEADAETELVGQSGQVFISDQEL